MGTGYIDGFRVFTFDPKGFPDPRGLDAFLHARGFKSVWMIDPGVKADSGYRVHDSGTAQDVWVHDAFGADYRGTVWPGNCVFPDFTRPETRAWWSSLYRDFMATWTGDNSSTRKNLEQSIPMTLNLGLSGQPFNGPDLG
jgi:alpha-glucosidase